MVTEVGFLVQKKPTMLVNQRHSPMTVLGTVLIEVGFLVQRKLTVLCKPKHFTHNFQEYSGGSSLYSGAEKTQDPG